MACFYFQSKEVLRKRERERRCQEWSRTLDRICYTTMDLNVLPPPHRLKPGGELDAKMDFILKFHDCDVSANKQNKLTMSYVLEIKVFSFIEIKGGGGTCLLGLRRE